MNYETLGDWCKWLEKNFSPERMIPELPVIIRIDGKNFSKWTRGLVAPYDLKFRELMTETTKFLVKETNAIVGYTQSDEITLILYSDTRDSKIYFDGKKQKILSVLSSEVTNFFNTKRLELLPEHNKIATFDCRVYQTPSKAHAVNQLLWRELDATRNSIQMLAHFHCGHSKCENKNSSELQDMLMQEHEINWNDYPAEFKRGTYVIKTVKDAPFSLEELDKLPAKHRAKLNPDLKITRTVFETIELPVLSKITNRADVFFNQHKPIVCTPPIQTNS